MAIRNAAKRLGVTSGEVQAFVYQVLEALSSYQIFRVELDQSATPAEILTSLARIKGEAERLRRRAGFHQIRPFLEFITAGCDGWSKNRLLMPEAKHGRRTSKALSHTIIHLILTIRKFAPAAPYEKIVEVACACLDAAEISYPDQFSHPDRFRKLFLISGT